MTSPRAEALQRVRQERRQLDALGAALLHERRERLLALPGGADVAALLASLSQLASEDAIEQLLIANSWLATACACDADLRWHVLMTVSGLLSSCRIKRGEPPFSDPLPGEPDNVDLRLRKFIGADGDPVIATANLRGLNMQVEIRITVESAQELALVSSKLADVMQQGGSAPANTDEPAAAAAAARRGRKPKDTTTTTLETSNTDEFVVMHADGARRAGYGNAADAVKVLVDELGTATTADQVGDIMLANKTLLKKLGDDAGPAREAADEKQQAFKDADLANLVGGSDTNEPSYSTEDVVKACRSYAQTHGIPEIQKVFKALGVNRASELQPKQYADAMKLLAAAETKAAA